MIVRLAGSSLHSTRGSIEALQVSAGGEEGGYSGADETLTTHPVSQHPDSEHITVDLLPMEERKA